MSWLIRRRGYDLRHALSFRFELRWISKTANSTLMPYEASFSLFPSHFSLQNNVQFEMWIRISFFSFSKWILNWDQIDYQCCSPRTCSSFKQLRGRNSIFKLQIFLIDSSQKYYTIFCLILCWHNGRELWFQIAALGSNVFHNSKPKPYATKCCTYYSSIPPLEKK